MTPKRSVPVKKNTPTWQEYAWDVLVLILFWGLFQHNLLQAFDSGNLLEYLVALVFLVLALRRLLVIGKRVVKHRQHGRK